MNNEKEYGHNATEELLRELRDALASGEVIADSCGEANSEPSFFTSARRHQQALQGMDQALADRLGYTPGWIPVFPAFEFWPFYEPRWNVLDEMIEYLTRAEIKDALWRYKEFKETVKRAPCILYAVDKGYKVTVNEADLIKQYQRVYSADVVRLLIDNGLGQPKTHMFYEHLIREHLSENTIRNNVTNGELSKRLLLYSETNRKLSDNEA